MEIERYDQGDEVDPSMYPHEDGDWVKYSDHIKALAASPASQNCSDLLAPHALVPVANEFLERFPSEFKNNLPFKAILWCLDIADEMVRERLEKRLNDGC